MPGCKERRAANREGLEAGLLDQPRGERIMRERCYEWSFSCERLAYGRSGDNLYPPNLASIGIGQGTAFKHPPCSVKVWS